MQRLACILLILMSFGLTSDALQQQQVRGQVVNRDGVPQQCQVDFFAGSGTDLQVPTGHGPAGLFLLNNPKPGAYRVVVVQGKRTFEFKRVDVDRSGIRPQTLVVPWSVTAEDVLLPGEVVPAGCAGRVGVLP